MRCTKPARRPDFRAACRIFVFLALVLGCLGMVEELTSKAKLPGPNSEGAVLYRWGRGGQASSDNLYRLSGWGEPTAIAARPLPEKLKPFFFYAMDLNRASDGLLQTVPGIGPMLARRIAKARGQNGPFRDVDELELIEGIGKAKLAGLRPFLTTQSSPIFLRQRIFSYPAAPSRSAQE